MTITNYITFTVLDDANSTRQEREDVVSHFYEYSSRLERIMTCEWTARPSIFSDLPELEVHRLYISTSGVSCMCRFPLGVSQIESGEYTVIGGLVLNSKHAQPFNKKYKIITSFQTQNDWNL